MSKRLIKVVSLFVGAVLVSSSFAGCASKTTDSKKVATVKTNVPTQTTATYPINSDVTLKYWMEMHSNVSSQAKNFADLPFAKELYKKTGIKVEYIHPVTGQAKEVFNIMVASGDLPDIIEYKWIDYPGGPMNAISNSIIIPLNEVVEKYSPNFKKYLQSNAAVNKQVKTDDGVYFVYPFIRGSKELQNTAGPMIRKDWLDELGLPMPETVDDWATMLKAFKEKKGATAPLTAVASKDNTQLQNVLEGAFNFYEFNHDNGKVKYTLIESGYKDYLKLMKDWFDQGLIDKNFATTDKQQMDTNILNGKSGATYGAGGGGMGTYLAAMKEKDPKFSLVGTKFPVAKKGDRVKYGLTNFDFATDSNGMAAITKSSKNVEIAARYLDYAYSEEGHIFYNFGTDGVSYKMVNGVPTYNELVMKNPDKLSVAQAMSKYSRGNTNGPFVQNKGYLEQFYELPQQKDAIKVWSDHDKQTTAIPPVSFTAEESAENAKIMADIKTYVSEIRLKIIMGKEPISTFDAYVDQVKKMNIDKVVANYQKALDRYNKR